MKISLDYNYFNLIFHRCSKNVSNMKGVILIRIYITKFNQKKNAPLPRKLRQKKTVQWYDWQRWIFANYYHHLYFFWKSSYNCESSFAIFFSSLNENYFEHKFFLVKALYIYRIYTNKRNFSPKHTNVITCFSVKFLAQLKSNLNELLVDKSSQYGHLVNHINAWFYDLIKKNTSFYFVTKGLSINMI